MELWRAFPWDPTARPGERFAPDYVGSTQVDGRFDLGCQPCVLYAAETPEHALAEKLQRYRGRKIDAGHLKEWDRPIAVAGIRLDDEVADNLADLGDPATLLRLAIRPDRLMSWDRRATQAIARAIHESGGPGFRCWSSLRGDWTVAVLFLDRVPVSRLEFGKPERIDLTSALLGRVGEMLGLELARR